MRDFFRRNLGGLKGNMVANYIGKAWSILAIYIFIPFYVQLLGIEAYGIIAVYTMALSLIFILDAGLSAAFTREVASEKNPANILALLGFIERSLGVALLVLSMLLLIAAHYIANSWFDKGGNLAFELKVDCLRLMVISIAPQVMISLYNGGMMGSEQQVRANSLTSLFGLCRSGLVLLPLLIIKDVRVFLLWQCLISWIFLWIFRYQLLGVLSNGGVVFESTEKIEWRRIGFYAGGMLLLSITSGLNAHLDKIIVSGLRTIEEFAHYSMASTLAQIPILSCMPIALAIFPRLTSLVASGHKNAASHLHQQASFSIASISSTAGICIFFFPYQLTGLWLHNQVLPEYFYYVLRILALANMLLAMQLSAFYLTLANDYNKINIINGVCVLLLNLPLQYYMTSSYGMYGSAFPWLILMSINFLFFGVLNNLLFYPPGALNWFITAVIPPVFISTLIMGAGKFGMDYMGLSKYPAVLFIFTLCLLSISVSVWCFKVFMVDEVRRSK